MDILFIIPLFIRVPPQSLQYLKHIHIEVILDERLGLEMNHKIDMVIATLQECEHLSDVEICVYDSINIYDWSDEEQEATLAEVISFFENVAPAHEGACVTYTDRRTLSKHGGKILLPRSL